MRATLSCAPGLSVVSRKVKVSGSRAATRTSPRKLTAAPTQNIACHAPPKIDMRDTPVRPARVLPKGNPTVTMPMAKLRRAAEEYSWATTIMVALMTPTPMPVRKRPPSMTAEFGARAVVTIETMFRVRPARIRRRRP